MMEFDMRRTTARGFSLLEMMLVLLIMSMLVGIVAINIGGQAKKAKLRVTRTKMIQIESMLTQFHLDKGSYPTSIEGLVPLVPNYMKSVQKDAWDMPFAYYSPTATPEIPFEIQCSGPDKILDTDDDLFLSEFER